MAANCSTADHRLFANVTADARPASAWVGTGGRLGGCVPPTAGPYEKGLRLTPAERAHGARPVPLCRQADLRNIYYGLLGPQARSITYVLGGQRHTLATIGPEGAYMFVTRASPKQLLNFANAGTADVVPVDGPVKEIHYRGGATCHLTAKSWIGGRYACTPSLSEPYGYAPVGTRADARAEAAATVHARLGRDRFGHRAILVSFRVPLSDHRRAPRVLDPLARTGHATRCLRRQQDRPERRCRQDRHAGDRRLRRAAASGPDHRLGLAAASDRGRWPGRAGCRHASRSAASRSGCREPPGSG